MKEKRIFILKTIRSECYFIKKVSGINLYFKYASVISLFLYTNFLKFESNPQPIETVGKILIHRVRVSNCCKATKSERKMEAPSFQ